MLELLSGATAGNPDLGRHSTCPVFCSFSRAVGIPGSDRTRFEIKASHHFLRMYFAMSCVFHVFFVVNSRRMESCL